MFELIRANKRNSIILITLMAAVLLVMGYFLGRVFAGPKAGFTGIIIATAVWFFLTILSFFSGDQILLASTKAVPVTHEQNPQLFNIVEEMKIAAGLPNMPKIYIIPDPSPNAFATGRNPQNASVAVTAGLLAKLNRDELQGVIAHEISHILHRDILFVTFAGIMLGTIVLLSQVFLRSMFYGSLGSGNRRYSSNSNNNGSAQLIMLVVAILAAILAPIMAQLLYFALSRQREYLADAGAARLTRYPEGLARALEKIANNTSPDMTTASKVTAPMYIINPFSKSLTSLTSTHPSTAERIKILRKMSQGASFRDYSDAYASVTGKKTIMPSAAVTKEELALREGAAQIKQQRIDNQKHQVGDIIRQLNGFLFLTCTCGLKLKIPPNYKQNTVTCPKCDKTLELQPAPVKS